MDTELVLERVLQDIDATKMQVGESHTLLDVADNEEHIREAKDFIDTKLAEVGKAESFVPVVRRTVRLTKGNTDEEWLEEADEGMVNVGIERVR